jgi:hypothetical protein
VRLGYVRHILAVAMNAVGPLGGTIFAAADHPNPLCCPDLREEVARVVHFLAADASSHHRIRLERSWYTTTNLAINAPVGS